MSLAFEKAEKRRDGPYMTALDIGYMSIAV